MWPYKRLLAFLAFAVFCVGLLLHGKMYDEVHQYTMPIAQSLAERSQLHLFQQPNLSAGITRKIINKELMKLDVLKISDLQWQSYLMPGSQMQKITLESGAKEYRGNFDFGPDDLKTFKPLGHPYLTYNNICFEQELDWPPVLLDKDFYTSYKKIIVYDNKIKEKGSKEVKMNFFDPSTHPRSFRIEFRQGPIPKTHTMLPYPAYFTPISCTANLYHFLRDVLSGLFGALYHTGRLGAQFKNQLFYRTSQAPVFSKNCHYKYQFEDFMFTMGILPTHGVFHMAAPYTCYRYGVFAHKKIGLGSMLRHIAKGMNITRDVCRAHQVTILQRDKRRILNIRELYGAAQSLGLNVQVVILERLSVREQFQIIVCTDLLVGVQGAGLQWATVMIDINIGLESRAKKRGLLELYFTNWKKMFSNEFAKSMHTSSLFSSDVTHNWKYVQEYSQRGKNLTQQEKDILNLQKELKKANQFKHADVTYNAAEFKRELKALADKVFG